ncbi:MAG: hypothetical protein H7A37_02165 [Chlamydiales bacterium]|nr:hypothetical protein [Chlamydiia bacterium]MCP5507096.1 hypothetical protein [Chlamydiales bacterium]
MVTPTGPTGPTGPTAPSGPISPLAPLTTGDSLSDALYTPEDLSGNLTLARFFDIIQEAINKFRDQLNNADYIDAGLRRGLYLSASSEMNTLRNLGTNIENASKAAQGAQGPLSGARDAYNIAVNNYNAGAPGEQTAVDTLNAAITDYNNGIIDDTQLQTAIDNYNAYVAARTPAINDYNAAAATYNAAVNDYNAQLATINAERTALGMPPLAPESTVVTIPPMEAAPTAPFPPPAPGAIPTLGARPGLVSGGTTTIPVSSTTDDINTYYKPTLERSLTNLNLLNTSIRYAKDFEEYTKLILRAQLKFLSNAYIERLPEQLLDGGSSGVRAGWATLGFGGLSSYTMTRAIALSLFEASVSDTNNLLSGAEVDQVRLLALSVLGNSAFFGAVQPTLITLSNNLLNLGPNDPAISTVLALENANSLVQIIDSQNLEETVSNILSNNPNIAGLPESDRQNIINRITSSLNLALSLNALLSLAIGLNAPGITAQVIGQVIASSDASDILAGITRESLFQPQLNDILSDRSVTVIAKNDAVQELIARGFTEEEAISIVNTAFNATLNAGPFPNLDAFANLLTANLAVAGIGSIGLAQAVAARATADIISLVPTANLDGNPLQLSLVLGLISRNAFLTNNALQTILEGVNPQLREAFVAALENLLATTQPGLFIGEPDLAALLSGQITGLPAQQLGAVQLELIRNLLGQGVSIADALTISQQFVNFILKDTSAQIALTITPQLLDLIRGAFVTQLVALGVPQTTAESLALALTQAALRSPDVLTNLQLATSVGNAAQLAAILRTLTVQQDISNVLVQQLGLGAAAAAETTGQALAILSLQPQFLGTFEAAQSALALALVRQPAIQIDLASAFDLAGEILRTSVSRSVLGAELTGTVADVLVGTGALNQAILTQALINQGIPPELAPFFATQLATPVTIAPAVGQGAEQAIRSRISDILQNELQVSGRRAASIAQRLSIEEIINTGDLTASVSQALEGAGLVSDEATASAIATTIVLGSLQIPGALSSEVALQSALINAIATTFDISSTEARDVVLVNSEAFQIGLVNLIQRETLIAQLTSGLTALGFSGSVAATLGAAGAAAIVRPAAASPTEALRAALTSALALSLTTEAGQPITFARAQDIAAQVDLSQAINVEALQGVLRDAIASNAEMSLEDAAVLAADATNLVLRQQDVFLSQQAFSNALNAILFLPIALNPLQIEAITQTITLEGILQIQIVKTALKQALIQSGFSAGFADRASATTLMNLLALQQPELPISNIADIAEALARERDLGFEQLKAQIKEALQSRALFTEDVADEVADATARRALESSDSAISEDQLRDNIRTELQQESDILDDVISDNIQREIIITEGIRKDIIKNDLIRAAERHDVIISDAVAKRVIDDAFRQGARIGNEDDIRNVIKNQLIVQGVVADETLAADIASGVQLGLLVGEVDVLASGETNTILSAVDLREEIINRVVSTLRDSVGLAQAREIAERIAQEVDLIREHIAQIITTLQEDQDAEYFDAIVLEQIEEHFRAFILPNIDLFILAQRFTDPGQIIANLFTISTGFGLGPSGGTVGLGGPNGDPGATPV